VRAKLIGVFSVVVLVVGVLAFALTRSSLGAGSPKVDAARALAAAEAVLRVEAREAERWLEAQAADPKMREPFSAGTGQARSDGSTGVANGIKSAASKNPSLSALGVSLVLLVDAKGVVLGRDGSQLMRGDALGGVYPALVDGLGKGQAGSDVWVTPARNEQMLVSWAPIRSDSGAVVGAVVLGTALSDGRLNRVAADTSGAGLLFGVKSGEGLRIVARSGGATAEMAAALDASPARESAFSALGTGQVVDVGVLPPDYGVKAGPLGGYGDGRRALVVAISRASGPSATTLLFPFLGAMALGILLVAIGGHYFGQYMSRPIEEIEEGLLGIMNGRTDVRFQTEHAELGGLASRLNSLLNQMLGVQEDEATDAEGHPAHGPTAKDFKEALSVDERLAERSDEGKALGAEDDDAYYKRIFDDYIRAKKSVGDPVDHISREAFVGRIVASERQMAQKHGKPVRYKVEVRGKEVVLLAVPLA
jgi:hypothetical protein